MPEMPSWYIASLDRFYALREYIEEKTPRKRLGGVETLLEAIASTQPASFPSIHQLRRASTFTLCKLVKRSSSARKALANRVASALPLFLSMFGEDERELTTKAEREDEGTLWMSAIDLLKLCKDAALPALQVIADDPQQELNLRTQAYVGVGLLPPVGQETILWVLRGLQAPEEALRTASVRCLRSLLQGEASQTAQTEEKAVVVAALGEAFGREAVEVRKAILETLGRLQATPALVLPLMLQALEDEDVTVARIAVDALGELGPDAADAAVPALLDLLARGLPIGDFRFLRAFQKLEASGPSVAKGLALMLLRNPRQDGEGFARSIRALGEEAVLPPILAALPGAILERQDEYHYQNLLLAIRELGFGRPEVAHALLEILQAPNPSFYSVYESIVALGFVGPAAAFALEAILPYLSPETYLPTRGRAAWAVGAIGVSTPEAKELLECLAEDETARAKTYGPGYCAQARIALFRLGHSSVGQWRDWLEILSLQLEWLSLPTTSMNVRAICDALCQEVTHLQGLCEAPETPEEASLEALAQIREAQREASQVVAKELAYQIKRSRGPEREALVAPNRALESLLLTLDRPRSKEWQKDAEMALFEQ